MIRVHKGRQEELVLQAYGGLIKAVNLVCSEKRLNQAYPCHRQAGPLHKSPNQAEAIQVIVEIGGREKYSHIAY